MKQVIKPLHLVDPRKTKEIAALMDIPTEAMVAMYAAKRQQCFYKMHFRECRGK